MMMPKPLLSKIFYLSGNKQTLLCIYFRHDKARADEEAKKEEKEKEEELKEEIAIEKKEEKLIKAEQKPPGPP